MRFTRFHVSGVLLAFFAPLAAHAATTYYVAPTGSDAANGTATGTPFATWGHAQSVAKPGDTVYFRAGKYTFTKGTTTCGNTASTIDGITLNVSGTAGNTINYFAYPGEVPVIDFSGIKDQCRVKGIDVTGSYIYLKGLEIMGTPQCPNPCQNHESWGIYVSNSHNTFELLNLHDNMGPGIYINSGGNNLVLNCDSHDNYDPYSWDRTNNVVTPGQNADGFGCHIGAGNTGNVFRGCRAWRNTDDGWDFIQAQEVCTVENSWAWNMGQAMYQGAIVKPSAGNGNGFKGGGYGEPPTNVPANPPSHVIQHCLSVGNKAAGFYANHEPAADHWYNNTSYGNNPGFNLLGDPANVGILRNNLALSGTLLSNNTGNGIDESFNSWDTNLGVTVSTADFQGMNVSVTGLDAARQADGSLPEVTNFHLVAGSDLIDKGTDVGLPFTGKAPDLGAFEYGATTSGAGGAGGAAGAGAGGAAGAGGTTGSGGTAGASTTGGAAGTGTAGTAGAAGTGTAGANTTGGAAGSGTAGTGTAGTGTAGASTSGGAAGTGTAGTGTAGTGTAGTSTGTSGGTAGTGTAGSGTAGSVTSGGAVGSGGVTTGSGGDTADEPAATAANQPGCSCRTAGGPGDGSSLSLLPLLALFGLGRRKRRV